jgi:hypothetical protein
MRRLADDFPPGRVRVSPELVSVIRPAGRVPPRLDSEPAPRRIDRSPPGWRDIGDHIVGEAHAAAPAAHRTAWRLWFTSPAVRKVALLVPATAGFVILQVAKGGDARFAARGEFFVWSALVAVAVAVWVAMSLGLLQTMGEFRGLFGNQGPASRFPACSASTRCTPQCCSPSSPWEAGVRSCRGTTSLFGPEPFWQSGSRPRRPRSWPCRWSPSGYASCACCSPRTLPCPTLGSVWRSYGHCGNARCGRWLRLA